MKSINQYQSPLKEGTYSKIWREDSPTHKDKLRYSIDFTCDEGTPIYAAAEGEVVYVKQDSKVGGKDMKYWNDGNRVVIKHNNGEYSAYEHLPYNGSEVNVGDSVGQGDLVGYSGNTGWTAGPHLHFEVFKFTGPNKTEDYETLEIKFVDLEE